ncbi:allatostatin-A receptor-like [Lingula anatina]|uniref:Allatostatin-A receptor-like n=1 Tax=Lingula anatina TaxID=7574 RepID=A0A1S3K612_LINAN|nr:allatostatin-A receptor-like [Lingula anatina]|eukprot:XP_013417869.1 allatostatin-A receptor-like [Lingula anatina]
MDDDGNSTSDETTALNRTAPAFFLVLAETNSILIPVLYAFVLLIGVAGNAMVIYVILANKYMRTCANMLFLNLAVSDLLFLVFCIPLEAAYVITKYQLELGNLACKMLKYTTFVCTTVGAYSLAAICVFRCRAVVSPIRASQFLTTRHSLSTTVVIWVTILAVNSPVAVYYNERIGCSIEVATELEFVLLLSLMVGVDFLLPVAIVVIATVVIVIEVKKCKFSTEEQLLLVHGYSRKVTALAIAVAGVFVVCWGPFNFLFVYISCGGGGDQKVMGILNISALFLAYSNSCLNPIIYNFASKEFRKSFRLTISNTCKTRKNRRRSRKMSSTKTKVSIDSAINLQECMGFIASKEQTERIPVRSGCGESARSLC